jgi:hypothetical protein
MVVLILLMLAEKIKMALTEKGGWITPFVLNPKNNQTIVAGYKNIWRTNNRGDSMV